MRLHLSSLSRNYIFDVSKDHLRDVLDRFAQFFVAPLCLKSAVDRELNAVNNENEKNLQHDGWRIAQLSESTLNPDHPISRFSTGTWGICQTEGRGERREGSGRTDHLLSR